MKRTTAAKNIELKARCRDLAAARRAVKGVGATRTAILHQVDTYFDVPNGRLKLREIKGLGDELIYYERADDAGPRDSRYFVIRTSDVTALKAALTAAMGVRAVVKKRRELWMFHNVRIHLDRVELLGDFIEFEAVISKTADVKPSRERLKLLTTALRIESGDRIATSYGNLVTTQTGLKRRRPR